MTEDRLGRSRITKGPAFACSWLGSSAAERQLITVAREQLGKGVRIETLERLLLRSVEVRTHRPRARVSIYEGCN